MNSNFTVTCPKCGKVNDFTGDEWHDELVDDTCDHDIPCMHCGKELHIRVDAVYTLSIPDDVDDSEEDSNFDPCADDTPYHDTDFPCGY